MKEFDRRSKEFEDITATINHKTFVDKSTYQLRGQNCFVAYLDVDGFKDRIYQDSEKLFEEFNSITRRIINIICGNVTITEPNDTIGVYGYDKILIPILFSDSYFLVTKDDSHEAFSQISTISAMIMNQGLSINLPTRGAISHGKVYFVPERNTLIGPAVMDAARIASNMEYFGIEIDTNISSDHFDSMTKELTIQLGSESIKRRFALGNAYLPHPLMTDQNEFAITQFEKLNSEYQQNPSKKTKIENRYKRSKEIVQNMFPS